MSEVVARYKSEIILCPANGNQHKLHVSTGARNFGEAQKEAIKAVVGFFLNSPRYPEDEKNSEIEIDFTPGKTERMTEFGNPKTKKRLRSARSDRFW